jgi:indolepyruvate ferredoxin oxidoreductase beta subunit
MSILNILIVGVGGQGTLLAGKVIGAAALESGYDVKISEVHGMAQRGGSVVTHVRIGIESEVLSPLVEMGCADIMIAFEELEALRWISFLKPGGKLVANLQQIDPMSVVTGNMKYPDNITEQLLEICADAVLTNALMTAENCGNSKAVNMVLLGAAAVYTPIAKINWLNAVAHSVPVKFGEVNTKAFSAGYDQVINA